MFLRQLSLPCLMLLSVIMGCSSSKVLSTPPQTFEELNRLLQGRNSIIQLTDGKTIVNAKSILLAADTTTYGLNATERLATDRIASIRLKKDSGAGVGFLFGAVPGLAFLIKQQVDRDEVLGSRSNSIGIGVAVIGGLAGAFIGDLAVPGRYVVVYERPKRH